GFAAKWKKADAELRARITAAREQLAGIVVDDSARERSARLCMGLGTDGLRGELTLIRAARALAAFDQERAVGDRHLRRLAPLALRHRLRRDPLDEAGSAVRVERAVREMLGA